MKVTSLRSQQKWAHKLQSAVYYQQGPESAPVKLLSRAWSVWYRIFSCVLAMGSSNPHARPRSRASFADQTVILRKLITQSYAYLFAEPHYLILEYVMYGKLLAYLRDHRTRQDFYNFSEDSAALTSRDLTVFGYCVARGMEYLASKKVRF